MNELDVHRPALLRHCYRMLGAFADAEDIVQDVLMNAWKARASYAGTAPVEHWLMRIATNACLNELARRKRRALPPLERAAATSYEHIEQLEAADWITPTPDLPLGTLESRESVALAFIALLQRLPPRQRAVLLLKDVVGWPAAEIAEALEMTVPSVNSALHRARETVTLPSPLREDPAPELLAAYIRTWEEHDLDGLVALLKDDIVLAMPPHATWFQGPLVGEFFRSERFARFRTQRLRVLQTRANGQRAIAYYVADGDGFHPHSISLVTAADGKIAEAIVFIGADYFRGFALPARLQ